MRANALPARPRRSPDVRVRQQGVHTESDAAGRQGSSDARCLLRQQPHGGRCAEFKYGFAPQLGLSTGGAPYTRRA